MALYCISFELCSAIVTPLKGDTIWGHIVWGIANHNGDEAVADFLKSEKSEPPALVVSSAFPAGMVCRPMQPPDRDELPNIDDYPKIKKKKKEKYVPASGFFSNVETENEEAKKKKQNPMKSVQVMHNTIDRFTNTVLEDRSPYSIEESWPKILEWDFYILSSFPEEDINQLVKWAFENGYGADASTGKGKIGKISYPVPVEPKEQGNDYMALGPFVGTKTGLPDLRADIFVRSGKLGGAFATSLSPYKKPVVLYDEGAVFKSDKRIEYTGRLLENMHYSDKFNICQSGFAPVIPVDLRKNYA